MEMKKCAKCKKEYPATLEYFYKQSNVKSNLSSICKKCRNKQTKDWKSKNMDKCILYTKKYNKQHPDKVKEWKHNYYLKHKEEIIRKTNEYRKQHLEKSSEYTKAWRKRNPEKYKSYKRIKESERRARIRNIKNDFTSDEWIKMKNSTNGICPMCGKNVGLENITIDYILPISKAPIGYVYTINDIQPLCLICNSRKQDKIMLGISS